MCNEWEANHFTQNPALKSTFRLKTPKKILNRNRAKKKLLTRNRKQNSETTCHPNLSVGLLFSPSSFWWVSVFSHVKPAESQKEAKIGPKREDRLNFVRGKGKQSNENPKHKLGCSFLFLFFFSLVFVLMPTTSTQLWSPEKTFWDNKYKSFFREIEERETVEWKEQSISFVVCVSVRERRLRIKKFSNYLSSEFGSLTREDNIKISITIITLTNFISHFILIFHMILAFMFKIPVKIQIYLLLFHVIMY